MTRLDLAVPSASALTDPSREVPRNALGKTPIPATYVPARNTLFLAHALAWGEAIGARDLFLGANALDYSGYPDCRPEFLEAFERMANLGTKAGVEGARFRVRAPLLALSKAADRSSSRAEPRPRLLADELLLRPRLRRPSLRRLRLLPAPGKGLPGGRDRGSEVRHEALTHSCY